MFHILAGSYAPADTIGVRRFRFDPELREFVPAAGRSGVPFPAYLARSAASGCYYAISETTAHSLPGPGTSAAQTGPPGSISALGPDPADPDGATPARPPAAAPAAICPRASRSTRRAAG